MKQRQKAATAIWYIVSGMVGGMVASVILPELFVVRQHPIELLRNCMIAGSFVGLVMSWFANK